MNRIPPKYHTLKTFYLCTAQDFNLCTPQEAIQMLSQTQQGLLDPRIQVEQWGDEDPAFYLTGFTPMTEAQRARVDARSAKSKEAARKRKQKKEEQEKDLLKKLASKYPDTI